MPVKDLFESRLIARKDKIGQLFVGTRDAGNRTMSSPAKWESDTMDRSCHVLVMLIRFF